MGAVLLGAARRDALVGDAELEPPDVEPVEAVNAGGGERGAVVTANRVRQAAGTEQVAEVRFHPGSGDVQQAVAAEQVAAEVIDDGQRVAVDAVAGAELAFEVDGPDLVRGRGGERSGARMFPPTVVPPRVGAAVAREDIEDGAARRPVALRITGAEALQDLAGSPAVARVFVQDQSDHIGRRLVRAGARGPAAVREAPRPFLPVPIEPLVAGVPADAVAEAEFGHRPRATLEVLGEMVTFEHGIGLLPGHHSSSQTGQEKCHPCARTSVTYVPRLYPGAA